MNYIQKIRFLMEEKHWSQNRLAKEAQLSQAGLSTILDGSSSPKLNTLESIATAFKCTVIDLLSDDYQESEYSVLFRESTDPNFHTLSPEEMKLIFSFRSLSQEGKDAVLTTLEGALIRSKKNSQDYPVSNDKTG